MCTSLVMHVVRVQKNWNFLNLNSPPLSFLKALIFFPICFLANALNSLNFESFFPLFLNININIYIYIYEIF